MESIREKILIAQLIMHHYVWCRASVVDWGSSGASQAHPSDQVTQPI